MAKQTEERQSIQQDVYKLWWEYLKRSDKFKEFCDLMIKLRRSDDEDHFKVYLRVEKKWMAKALTKTERKARYHECYRLYLNWEEIGDVFNEEFDNWKSSPLKDLFHDDVINLADARKQLTLMRVLNTFDELKKKNKRKGDVELLQLAIADNPFYVFVAVPIFGDITSKEIAEQITMFRRELQKDGELKPIDERFKRHRAPLGRIRLPELRRYLSIYDMKRQGMKMREIAKALGRHETDVYERRTLNMDLQKAKAIICNVERGYFPGNYQ